MNMKVFNMVKGYKLTINVYVRYSLLVILVTILSVSIANLQVYACPPDEMDLIQKGDAYIWD
jgi:hypothetical protein